VVNESEEEVKVPLHDRSPMQMLGKRKDFDNVPDSANVVDENGLIPFDL
jgi:hypothetical protein